MNFLRKKPVVNAHENSELHRCLSAWDLTLLGIGAIVGAGIFVLTGISAATAAGPSIIVSFLLAGCAAAFSALSYAELSAAIGGCGSAYGYAYAGLGEIIAWIIGWDLLLEYGMACSTVAIGWASYVKDGLQAVGVGLPAVLLEGPFEGGDINLLAMLIILVMCVLLCVGVRESARFNSIIVFIKLLAIGVFITVACKHINFANWHPFFPFGWHGVVSGAAIIFFSYIGFDAVSTAAEEAINPQRDLPIGILASLAVCTLLYIIVAGLLTGIVPFHTLDTGSPVADALLRLGEHVASGFVAAGAVAGLTTVILVMYYGLTRVFLAMSRDGLLPLFFSRVNVKTKTPVPVIASTGIIMMAAAGFIPMHQIAELVNIGTLAAFILVCAGVIVMRYQQPDLERPFKTPFSPLVPMLGILFSGYLILYLNAITLWGFLIWTIIGLVVYFIYGRKHSKLQL